ncbi:hypothetical protein VNO78_17947 [Psophocarpus tetragonolobus]|uniref:non-specific serine/threonine protein kinase n=1 Tax=Psophocarpus tetragonolobus TaxID=3891 RepID=A0AAN9SNI7_PSOTE
MGNICVGSKTSEDAMFPFALPSSFWWHQQTSIEDTTAVENVEEKPPQVMKMLKSVSSETNIPSEEQTADEVKKRAKGLEEESILKRKSGHFKEQYNLGEEIGNGQYGTTFICTEKGSGKKYACKSIPKVKLVTDDDVEDVRREIEIMHHLEGCPNVISIKGAYEDAVAVYVVMELCKGGELFQRIVEKGHYTERKAATLARTIVTVVEGCHSRGVMHRDLKPENFLFLHHNEHSTLKAIDFGLSIFFKPGDIFTDVVGSPFYIAPEVLKRHYGPEADVWSAGVIIYALLSGALPFWGESEKEIFRDVLHGDLDLSSDPWPNISESAKDLVRKMLDRDPRKRITAHEVLRHPWIQVGVAPNKPFDSAVCSCLKQFSEMNKLKKMAPTVIAENLSEEEISELKAIFKMIDTEKNGQITLEKLKAGLKMLDANLSEPEILDLMKAADVDKNGTIDYREFIAATLHLNKVDREDHLVAAFSYFDRNGSGYFTKDELQKAFEEFGMEDVCLEEMIQEVDQNNDGRIDYNEFVAMMQRGSADLGKNGVKGRTDFIIGYREAVSVC